ncbi:MAG: SirB1 family protein [Candidatus Xenobia bacterium]
MHEPSRAAFAALVAEPDVKWDLARAALLMACQAHPDLDVPAYLGQLDALGDRLLKRVSPNTSPREALDFLNALLFDEEGFHGNSDDYYSPANSLLNEVLDQRAGIPITLSLVYCEVGRRGGLTLSGVALPGHFMVKLERPSGEDILLDPFHRGLELDADECRRRALQFVMPEAWSDAFLVAAPAREILARMLRNLKAIYAAQDESEDLLWVCDHLVLTCPDRPEELRDRGLVHFNLRHYARAVADLAAYLETGDTDDRVRIEDVLRHARRMHAMMN